jgi:histidinol-phosphate aminotransferase
MSKILLINGSPHETGCTYTALSEVAASLHACGVETELLWLGTQPVAGCIACGKCYDTGRCVFDDKVNDLLARAQEFDGMVVVDEAYIDFAEAESLKSEIGRYPNIVVLQTMSKAWAMAGLRLGLALADSRVVEIMSQVKYPYNINKAALQIVEQLLEESIDDKVAEIVEQRGVVAEELAAMSFVSKVYPSDAHFVLVKVDDADAIYEHLITDGIIVRNRNRVRGCEGCLRITIGTKQENEKLIKSLERYE